MARVILIVLALSCATVARADPSAERFAEGVKLLEKGDAVAACAKFQQALEARPGAPGVLLNLGLCNLKQNKLATALKWFREAQLRAAERGQTETETAAKQQTVKLAAIVPTIRIELSAPLPEGGLVLLDGVPIDHMKLARFEIDAGRHTLAVSGPGLERTEQTIEVPDQPADPLVVPLTVRTAIEVVPPSKPVPVKPHHRPTRGHRGLAIGLAATSVAALAVGGFFVWDASYLADQRDKELASCTRARPCSGAVLDDYDRRGSRANTIAIVGFIAGGAALTASAVLFAIAPRESTVVAPLPGGAIVARAFAW